MTTVFAVKIGDSLQQGFDRFFAFLPKLIAFFVILIVGYIVAKIVKAAVTKLLQGIGADRALHSGSVGEYVNKVNPNFKPSSTIGQIVFYFIFLGVVAIAVSALGIQALENFIASITAYLPNVVAAILIFLVAGAVAAAVGGLVARTMGDTPTGKIVGTVAPILVMGIATFMILTQLKIAPQIVMITYIALLGAVSLGLALAFGLGGQDVAGRMLSDAYNKGQQNKDQVKQDFQKGKEQAKSDAQTAQQKAQEKSGQGGGNGPSTGAQSPGQPGQPGPGRTTL
ncbi:MAG: CmpX [uncultured Solirubrobacteraceae bacterium]|uniref:CmpX n=1 Tax=uncultured Solirubrobacteraceae bacterium TaxID=1162706 RepID=A0A6J4S597_9ACTN|nr:MAG: CmpX [uncultured Solirubrobacteraceae bacterium]